MLTTIILVATLLGLLVVSGALWALFLRLGLRWAKVPDATLGRIAWATIAVTALQAVMVIPLLALVPRTRAEGFVLLIALLAIGVIMPILVIARVFKVSLLRSVKAWLPTLLAGVGTSLIADFVYCPYFFEAFKNPTNAMAPTLLGRHWRSVCPECGRANYCTPVPKQYSSYDAPWMICGSFHTTQTGDITEQVHTADRFLVAKWLTPRRWDLIVFRYPEEPSTLYIMRLVGLPGERLHIEDGAVWINGERLEPPPELRGIEYLSETDFPIELWGSRERPAVLDRDEYFVLGDFSRQAKDSRWWTQGAAGHHPYAVPESYVRGVATHIYWPPRRLRKMR